MSSSSDIEKLFDHFGGDANAYQEIGRENEARSARTRWPLLVTLDLSQPAIPAIGQHARTQPPVAATPLAVDPHDTTPKDAASVTRAKAPLFTRSHRRDIPPVAVAAAPSTAPRGASRFGELVLPENVAKIDAVAPAASASVRVDAVAAEVVPAAVLVAPASPVAPVTPAAAPAVAPIFATVPSATSASSFATFASAAPVAPIQHRAPAMQPIPPIQPAALSWPQPAQSVAAAAPAAPPSILGKLFTPEAAATPPQPAASQAASAPLHSVFDRLRGTPAQTVAAPASATRAAAPAPSNSWLVNGPRRS
ncbi:cellulose biosynthesis protein BcsP [Paraburkholderia bryophila]|uniref:cellulose biosynthesis protein BcsP n=1 Tax=Paraburkholderia bryophila TaxID=420952 RepID=UPI0023498A2D|nr:cellulose biosynthesis protein BcsP [Paraburkholderia bryophila]WCM22483.1 cellulose biosynthesis protein BcsP [Paraburkholderia bryophila]